MKTYPIKCHVCGREFDLQAEFFSCRESVRGTDGKERLYGTCNHSNSLPKHSPGEIRASYDRTHPTHI